MKHHGLLFVLIIVGILIGVLANSYIGAEDVFAKPATA
jgi:hypothetical protein